MLEKKILDQLIKKGGAYASYAQMYYNDKEKARLFIYELSEQCHIEYSQKIWGKTLIGNIRKYTKNKADLSIIKVYEK